MFAQALLIKCSGITIAQHLGIAAMGPWSMASLAGLVLVAVVIDHTKAARELSKSRSDTDLNVAAPRRVLIVGAGTVGQTLAQELQAGGGYEVVGFVDDTPQPATDNGMALLGTRDQVSAVVRQYAIDDVFVAYAPTWQQQLADELTLEAPRVQLWVVPTPFEAALNLADVQHAGDIALVQLKVGTQNRYEFTKRAFDLISAALGLLVLSPLLLAVSAIIRITSPGPVIFSQERVGRYGRSFILYKFRTMVKDAELATGPVLAGREADPRLTPIGYWLRKFRIDEIPQLWNVLRGDMSLVGPRPERPHFVAIFQAATPAYRHRHDVRPGITGLAQVCAGYHTDARDKLRFDLLYTSYQSLWLDLRILFRTIGVVTFWRKRG